MNQVAPEGKPPRVQEAWQQPLRLLRAKPRTDKRPPWSGISTLRAVDEALKKL